jgi:hypothetical protein
LSIFKTVKANEKDNHRAISIQSLPKTYQDAVFLTRKLGIPYIWIDSLCIVQDDPAEWQEEASKMADIYQASMLTIAAASAHNGSIGLFLDSLKPPTKLVWDDRDTGPSESNCYARCPVGSSKSLWNAPLNSRGWVLQELILARRILYCADDQFYWQCRSRFTCEDGHMEEASFGSVRKSFLSVESGRMDFTAPLLSLQTWWIWVMEYSRRHLTYHHDRIPAIAGMTNYYRNATSKVSALGLWTDTMWFDLGWRISGDEGRIVHTRLETIPSWTWICIPPSYKIEPAIAGLDRYKESDFQNKLALIDWRVSWTGKEFTSPILSSLLETNNAFTTYDISGARQVKYLEVDFSDPMDASWDGNLVLDLQLSHEERKQVSFLLLFETQIYEFFLGLVDVIPIESTEGIPSYKRIGIGMIHRARGRQGWFHGLSKKTIRLT